jgi:hypothetical protein
VGDVQQVAGDGGITQRTYADVQIRELRLLEGRAGLDVIGPFLLVGRHVRAAFREPEDGIVGVEGEILVQIVAP